MNHLNYLASIVFVVAFITLFGCTPAPSSNERNFGRNNGDQAGVSPYISSDLQVSRKNRNSVSTPSANPGQNADQDSKADNIGDSDNQDNDFQQIPFALPVKPVNLRIEDDFIPFADESEQVRADLTQIRNTRSQDVPFVRYISLTHLNYLEYDDAMKFAQSKADIINSISLIINSLSTNDFVTKPTPINEDMSLFRIDIRDYNWSAEQWDALMVADENDPDKEAYPYTNSFDSTVLDAARLIGTNFPIVRGDWLVREMTKAGPYNKLLEIESLDQLEARLGVSRIENIQRTLEQPNAQPRAIRVGIGPGNSGVSTNNRIIERHNAGVGTYWISYDFGSAAADITKDIFSSPIGPGPSIFDRDDSNQSPVEAFRPDGGEVIFSLPNGLYGYALVDSAGNILNEAPTNIVFNPRARDDEGVITNGLPCMECHSNGLLAAKDEIRPFILAADDEIFTDYVLEGTAALYVEQSVADSSIAADNILYRAAAYDAAFWGKLERGFAQGVYYYEKEMALDMLASELNITVEQFERIRPRLSLELRTAILSVDSGKLDREVFEDLFPQLLEEVFNLVQ